MAIVDSASDVPFEARIQKAIELMRPYLQAEGVRANFEYVESGKAFISITCTQPRSAAEIVLLKIGVEKKLLEQFKDLKSVELI
ncbi:MAG: hypothetical protein SFY68_15120 [Candidatus Sumerlaeia bacterium]|nr:hypothetical protein [Candidatus Sumerlaeia bacterium]